jgi:hypothetical protein
VDYESSQEHRWRRLKQLVKPFVDDTVSTCVQLICAAWPALDGKTTYEDARSCRETMLAYMALDAANEEVTFTALTAEYSKVKSDHRGVYDSQKDQLMAMLEMPQTAKQLKNAATVQARIDTKKVRDLKNAAASKKIESQIRSKRNQTAASTIQGKADAALRKAKFKQANPETKHRRVKKRAKCSNIFNVADPGNN